ncbi:MAG: MFS transporter [Bacilli bacterium]
MKLIVSNPLFRQLLLLNIISKFGDAVYYIALISFASSYTNPSLAIMIVTLSESLPIFLSPFVSTYADRSASIINGIIISDLLRFFIYLGVAFLIGFEPSLLIIVAICLLNLLSDIFGQYNEGLQAPLLKHTIDDEFYAEAIGTTRGLNHLLTIISAAVGGILLAALGFQWFASINAFTFLLCAFLIIGIKTTLEKKIPPRELESNPPKVISNVKAAFLEIYHIKEVFHLLLFIMFLNGILSTILPLFNTKIANEQNLVINNLGFTIALLSISTSTGAIIGSLFGVTFTKKIPLYTLLKITYFCAFLSIITLQFGVISAFFVSIFGTCCLTGTLAPKIFGLFMKILDASRLATLLSIISLILMSGAQAMTLVIVGISGLYNYSFAIELVSVLSFIALICAFFVKSKPILSNAQEVVSS